MSLTNTLPTSPHRHKKIVGGSKDNFTRGSYYLPLMAGSKEMMYRKGLGMSPIMMQIVVIFPEEPDTSPPPPISCLLQELISLPGRPPYLGCLSTL